MNSTYNIQLHGHCCVMACGESMFCAAINKVHMLWFNFIYGLKFLKPFWFSFPFVSDYDNEHKTMENKNQAGLKNFKPNIKLNHNTYNNKAWDLIDCLPTKKYLQNKFCVTQI